MDDVIERFRATADRVVWANLATVDPRGRPRSRVVHPLWTLDDGALRGWVTTRRTPAKVAHLEHAGFVSVAYWSPDQATAVAECEASWVSDDERLRSVWDLAAALPPPVGFDPAGMYAGGPSGGDFAVVALAPWQLQVRSLDDLVAGRRPAVWRPTAL